MIGVDGGSTDPGPYYLGSGKSLNSRMAMKRDLRLMLRGATRRHPAASSAPAAAPAASRTCRNRVASCARSRAKTS